MTCLHTLDSTLGQYLDWVALIADLYTIDELTDVNRDANIIWCCYINLLYVAMYCTLEDAEIPAIFWSDNHSEVCCFSAGASLC